MCSCWTCGHIPKAPKGSSARARPVLARPVSLLRGALAVTILPLSLCNVDIRQEEPVWPVVERHVNKPDEQALWKAAGACPLSLPCTGSNSACPGNLATHVVLHVANTCVARHQHAATGAFSIAGSAAPCRKSVRCANSPRRLFSSENVRVVEFADEGSSERFKNGAVRTGERGPAVVPCVLLLRCSSKHNPKGYLVGLVCGEEQCTKPTQQVLVVFTVCAVPTRVLNMFHSSSNQLLPILMR